MSMVSKLFKVLNYVLLQFVLSKGLKALISDSSTRRLKNLEPKKSMDLPPFEFIPWPGTRVNVFHLINV